jgi:TrmH family RNA methyltransferase
MGRVVGEIELASPANPKIKRLVGLRDRDNRDQERVFLAEGPRLLERGIDAGHLPAEVYYVPGRYDPSHLPRIAAHSCSDAALSRASYRGSHDGVIAVFRQRDLGLEQIEPGSQPLLLLAEGLEKPGNLGAILRTGDAVGAAGVVAVGGRVDVFNPNVVRASTGAIFTVPIAVAELAPTAEWLSAEGISLIAASPDASQDHWSVDLTLPCALLVGSESDGITSAARSAADQLVRIPMRGRSTDSLNASVSLALLAFEALRQREGSGSGGR